MDARGGGFGSPPTEDEARNALTRLMYFLRTADYGLRTTDYGLRPEAVAVWQRARAP